jgi:Protein of unknown function (DUF3309)
MEVSLASNDNNLRLLCCVENSVVTGVQMLLLILTIVLLVALIGSVPKWPHSRGWGYYPSGGVGLILVILLILFLLGRL